MTDAACLLPYISTEPKGQEKPGSDIFLHVLPRDVKVKKPFPMAVPPPSGLKQSIFQFSDESRRRLLEVCRNSGHLIKSQFCLTYHEAWPLDGREVKKNLNAFITQVVRAYGPSFHYLWALEFQQRGAPHIHFFMSIKPKRNDRAFLAALWVRIIGAGPTCLAFHDHPANFFKWDMSNGNYLSKEYLAKSVQKGVPEVFQNVGRFWGHSRSMKPVVVVVDINEQKPDVAARIRSGVRILSKQHSRCRTAYKKKGLEKALKRGTARVHLGGKLPRISKPNPRKTQRSYTLPSMTGLLVSLVFQGSIINTFTEWVTNYGI